MKAVGDINLYRQADFDGKMLHLHYARAIEFHFTPKHGSWLNMAELELSALSRQCLDRRIESQKALAQEVRAWEQQRNEQGVKLSGSFTTTVAREKLKRHYDNLRPKN